MRQLIAVALFCAGLFCIAQAQVPMTGAGLGAPASGFNASCSQSSTFLAAATSITLTADKTNYDTMICGLVADGEFSKLDVLYIFAAPNNTSPNPAVINIAKPGTFNGTVHGTCTFTASQGYTGDGSSCFIDSGFNPNTASSPNYVQNSASCGAYDRSTRSSSGNLWAVGNQNGCEIAPYNFATLAGNVNSNTTMGPTFGSNAQGAYIVTRTTSSLESIFVNSNETASASSADTSQAVANLNIYFLAGNFSPAALFTTDQIAAGLIGGGLSGTDSCKINNRINTFMTAYSTNIYSNSAC